MPWPAAAIGRITVRPIGAAGLAGLAAGAEARGSPSFARTTIVAGAGIVALSRSTREAVSRSVGADIVAPEEDSPCRSSMRSRKRPARAS